MAKTSTKKNATAPSKSMSRPGTSNRRGPAIPPPGRLFKGRVMKVIKLLQGCTVDAVLGKLHAEEGGGGITRVQVKKAIQRLLEDRAIKEVAKGRFSLCLRTKMASGQTEGKSSSKAAPTTVKGRAGFNKNNSASTVPTAGGRSSFDITSNIPQEDDRDDESAQKKLDNNCENPRASLFTCGSMMGSRPMDTQCEADSTPRRVNDINTTGTSKMVKTGPAIYVFGAMSSQAFPKI